MLVIVLVGGCVGQAGWGGGGGGTSVGGMLLFCIDEVCMMTWSGSRVEIRVVVGSRAGLMVGLWVGSMVGLWVGSW